MTYIFDMFSLVFWANDPLWWIQYLKFKSIKFFKKITNIVHLHWTDQPLVPREVTRLLMFLVTIHTHCSWIFEKLWFQMWLLFPVSPTSPASDTQKKFKMTPIEKKSEGNNWLHNCYPSPTGQVDLDQCVWRHSELWDNGQGNHQGLYRGAHDRSYGC